MLHRTTRSILAFTFALAPCVALLTGCPEEKKEASDAESTPAPKVTGSGAAPVAPASATPAAASAPAADAGGAPGAKDEKDGGHEAAKADAGKTAAAKTK